MDAARVFRVISLIPDRAPRAQSGCLFSAEGKEERVALVERLLHWLSPLDSLSVENQKFLGLRSGGGRPAAAGEEPLDEEGMLEEADEADQPEEPSSIIQPGVGTQIAV